MADLHFIWYGPFPAREDYYTTAKVIAKVCRNHRINFWCRNGDVFFFKNALGKRNINVRPCDRVERLVGDLYTADQQWYAGAQEALDGLAAAGAWSACKDLACLLILHTYGGYYLDTTTLITPGSDGSALNAAFSEIYPEPRFPRILDPNSNTLGYSVIEHQPMLQTGVAILLGKDGRAEATMRVPLIDVWAAYSLKGHSSLRRMFMSYVSRCHRMGISPGGEAHNFDGVVGNTELQNGGYRDTLIGNLIIRAVYDGLLELAFEKEHNQPDILSYTWPTDLMPRGSWRTDGKYRLAVLGINKRYTGSWRTGAEE